MDRIRRGCAAAAVLMGVLGACGGGSSEEGSSSTSATTSSSTVVVEESSTTSTTSEPTTTTVADMPDVVGMTEDEARSLLLEIGVDSGDILVDSQESLQAAGTVIESVPSAGGRISGSVNLLIAEPVGDVPDFAGQLVSVVREWAEERGIAVKEQAVPDEALPEGQVIDTTPPAGQQATSEIVVRFATKPLVVSLADLSYTNDPNCDDTHFGIEASVNGEFQQDSIVVSPYESSDNPCVIEYNLGRDWTRLKATVGIEDSSDTEVGFRVQIYADDHELWNNVVSFAQPIPLDVDMTNVLRLKIVVTTLIPDADGWVVLGNVRLIGEEGTVPSTTATTS